MPRSFASPRWRWFAFAFAIALSALHVAPARADDVADEADLQFQLGAERYQAADYRGALQHFLASNRLVANRNVLFNIARSYEQLHHYADAFRYYVRALEGEQDAATRRRIEDALKRVAPNVAVLRVETDPPGAKIYLDRKDLGERGNAPSRLGLLPGKYRVIAELAGYVDAESSADVRVGSETPLALKLTRIIGTVRVEGEGGARGASVRVDTEDSPVLGTVPCEVDVPPGRRTLLIMRPGFQTTQLAVDVRARATIVVRPQITAQTGTLVVDADERDALIEIDGQPQGLPSTVLTVAVGTHRVRVALKGFRPVERTVSIESGKQSRIDVKLVGFEEVAAASRTTESVEDAPSSVSIVPSLELRAMEYPTLAEALRGVRGVFASDDRGYVSLGFRGFGRPGDYGNRVLVLNDGMPMNDDWLFGSYVGYDLRTDLGDVDRIEVVRGPGSVLYGTSAFSGVINIVPRGRDVPDGVEVGVSAAEYGMARGRVRVTKHFDEHSGAWTSFAGGHSSGRELFFPDYVADGPPTVAGHARGVDGVQVGTWMGSVWWRALTVQWSLNSHEKHLPAGQFDTILGDERTRQTDTRAMVEARFEPKLSDVVQSFSRAHANYYGYRGTFAHLPPIGAEFNRFDGAWAGLEQRFLITPSARSRFTVGVEGQHHFVVHQFGEDEQHRTFLDEERRFQVGAAYALADVSPTDRVKLSAGARLDAYSTFGTSLNPRVAVIVKPYDGGNLKIMAGKAFRAPSIYELYYRAAEGQVASPNLSPENIFSGEIEMSHRFSPSTVALVSVYGNYIRGLIALRNLEGPIAPGGAQAYAYQNTQAPVVTLGAEAELRREWKEGWMLSASYSLQRSQYVGSESLGDLVTLAPNAALREVPNAPTQLASVRGAVPILQRALVAMTRISVEGPRFDRNDTNATDTPAQRRTDAAVIWDLVMSGVEPRWGVRYALGFYNLFDWRWVAPVSTEFRQTSVVQNGRTVLASVGATF